MHLNLRSIYWHKLIGYRIYDAELFHPWTAFRSKPPHYIPKRVVWVKDMQRRDVSAAKPLHMLLWSSYPSQSLIWNGCTAEYILERFTWVQLIHLRAVSHWSHTVYYYELRPARYILGPLNDMKCAPTLIYPCTPTRYRIYWAGLFQSWSSGIYCTRNPGKSSSQLNIYPSWNNQRQYLQSRATSLPAYTGECLAYQHILTISWSCTVSPWPFRSRLK